LVVISLAGMVDWGLDLPLDAEERLLTRLLREPAQLLAPAARDLRLELGLDLFRLHLSALGLDFDLSRSGADAALRAAVGAGGVAPDDALIARIAARLSRGFKELVA
jgi:hypothetical protein